MSTDPLSPLWRRILDEDTPDLEAASQLLKEATRAFPNLASALSTAPESPRVFRGDVQLSGRGWGPPEFDPGVRVILGDLEIQGPADLDALAELAFVSGRVSCGGLHTSQSTIQSLRLPALTAIGGAFELCEQRRLSHLDLARLQAVESLFIYRVPLSDFDGLARLRRCKHARILLEPETALHDMLPELHTETRLELFRSSPGLGFLRVLHNGALSSGWRDEVQERDDREPFRSHGELGPHKVYAADRHRPVGMLVCTLFERHRFALLLYEGHNTIGRSFDNTICFTGTVQITKHHLTIIHHNGVTILEDGGTVPGTLVNGMRIQRHQVSDGEGFRFGPVDAIFWSFGRSGSQPWH